MENNVIETFLYDLLFEIFMDMDKLKIQEIKDFFSQLVQIMEEKAVYADCLYTSVHEKTINKDKTQIDIDDDADIGCKLRVFDGKKFIEKGITGFDKEKLTQAALQLKDSVKEINMQLHNVELLKDQEEIDKDFVQEGEIDHTKISLHKKVDFINKLQKRILTFDKRIVNARVMYEELYEVKIFVNHKKRLSQVINGCLILLLPFVQTPTGEIRYHYKSVFKAGYEATKISDDEIKNVCHMALHMLEAKRITPGKYTCLLTPALSGLLAHESFGHGMEADTMFKGRAKASEYVGKKIAPDNVSIVDNPSYTAKHGSFFFDDEGQITGPTYLIKNGVVNNPITDLYSASRLHVPRSGNARGESYDHKAFARMSNTYFMNGNDDPDEMLKNVEDGYYLHYSSGGMEDPKGWGTQIQGIVAEKIKNGKLTKEFFYEIGLTGFLPTILSNITKVGNKLDIPGTGKCGKGHKEWVRVSEGGSHLLIKQLHLS